MTRRRLSERQLLVVLMLVSVALALGRVRWPDHVPVSTQAIPLIIGGWRLSLRSLVALSAVVGVALVVELARSPVSRSFLAAAVVVVVAGLAFRYVLLRERWGLRPRAGMALLLNIRDRIRAQGEPPALTGGWVMARALRSAGDEAFRGDFTLVHVDDDRLQVMVVDVSGHGLGVASRSTQLAGAFGGLIGVVPAEQTLDACNDYLVRQQWDHDYATAVHLDLDLESGLGHLRSAGHPAAGVRRVDAAWERIEPNGPILGLSRAARFDPAPVQLDRGDVLVLVSDGSLAEDANDPAEEWAPVVTAVEHWLADGARGGTHELPLTPHRPNDDQTIVVVGQVAPAG